MVTLDDPDKLNVLSAGLTRQLRAALEDLVTDRAIRSIVLTGAGTWEAAITMEEFAEPQRLTTGAFQRSVEALLTRG